MQDQPAGPLVDAVRQAFAPGGDLAAADPAYRERQVQQELAAQVAAAVESRTVLVAEAGTGVGKTYAYLVPLLLSGARALVSTATKGLQDQLFLRDLPRLVQALRLPVRLALLKGRAAYLCPHRLAQARDASLGADRLTERALARIEAWAQSTRSGDLAEVEGLDERSAVIPLVTSTRENCLGPSCPQAGICPVLRARREAMQADIVVVNHHLFFADMVLRDTGVAELLPSVDALVFDEAHQLAAAGVQFLGTVLGTAQVADLARDMLSAGLQQARGLQPWAELGAGLDRAARDLRLAAAGSRRAAARLHWDERAGEPAFMQALQALAAAGQSAADAAHAVAAVSPDFDKLGERARNLTARAQHFAAPSASAQVRWIDLGPHQARLVESPLDLSGTLGAQIAAAPRAWVFTSATLGDDERLSWFTGATGLQDQRICRVGSPFDYAGNARLYVPARFPKPGDPSHPPAVAELAARLAVELRGRTFVLTTTLRALQSIGAQLVEELAPLGVHVLVQGQSTKRTLLARFLAGPPAVLVGSHSFWEGIDVPGEALQCVVIDKLPFPPPNDPLVEAHAKRVEGAGGNAFMDYFVPEAAVSLKQGAGRLIRGDTDRGLLVICDPRLHRMSYGRRLLAALPPMPQLPDEEAALAWLRHLRGEPASAWDDEPSVLAGPPQED
ncbi:MAG TPA: ATP-dependent DNA helicase [Burkholderiaceae bacterium]|nr:ATP-dependent DNA helicase [Burkholderiaceae bacterium]